MSLLSIFDREQCTQNESSIIYLDIQKIVDNERKLCTNNKLFVFIYRYKSKNYINIYILISYSN